MATTSWTPASDVHNKSLFALLSSPNFFTKDKKVRPINPTISSFFGASISDVENAARRSMLRRESETMKQKRLARTLSIAEKNKSLDYSIEAARVKPLTEFHSKPDKIREYSSRKKFVLPAKQELMDRTGLTPGQIRDMENREKKWNQYGAELTYAKMKNPDITPEEVDQMYRNAYRRIEGREYVPERSAFVTYYHGGKSESRVLKGRELEEYEAEIARRETEYQEALRIYEATKNRKFKNISLIAGNEKYL